MSAEDKRAIRIAFGKAASAYDTHADMQRHIARQLLARATPINALQALDAGAGTGDGSRLLRSNLPETNIISLDSAYAMCVFSGEPLSLCGDIENLPLAANSIDLYWSSLAWQWAEPVRAISEAARVLRSDGQLYVATLGPTTMHELREAFSGIDEHRHVRRFTDVARHIDELAAHGFEEVAIETHIEYSYAPDLPHLLREIRGLGAHELGSSRRRGLLGRNSWRHVQECYEHFRTPKGLPVTYEVIYISGKRVRFD